MAKLIALYSADGELTDWISPQRLARLESAGLIARVVRHPKGHVNRAYLYRRPGEGSPVTLGQYLGTRYHRREQLETGYVCWALRHIRSALRPFFLTALLDCYARAIHHG